MLWIFTTIVAAVLQLIRSVYQKKFRTETNAFMVTWCRNAIGFPFILLFLAALFPFGFLDGRSFSWTTGLWILGGAMSQLTASVLQSELLGRRSLVIGVGLVKVEPVFSMVLGLWLLGDTISPVGIASIICGTGAIICLLGGKPKSAYDNTVSDQLLTTIMGFSAGLIFAFSSIASRASILSLKPMHFLGGALVTLTGNVIIQTIVLTIIIWVQDSGSFRRLFSRSNLPLKIGLSSSAGSICWFISFSLANVAYVKTVGQLELVLSWLAGKKYFNERPPGYELAGIALIMVSAVMLGLEQIFLP